VKSTIDDGRWTIDSSIERQTIRQSDIVNRQSRRLRALSLDRSAELPTVFVETLLKSWLQPDRGARDPEGFSGLHHRCATVTSSTSLGSGLWSLVFGRWSLVSGL
jgi:hypothetical protein